MKQVPTGTILDVDLTRGTVVKRPLDPEQARRVLGGLGLAVEILYRELPPGTDAYDPRNIIILSPGPLSGTAAPTNSRSEIVTKSPLTGTIGRGSFGGDWGAKLKMAGYDAIVVRGASPQPVQMVINDGAVELRPAAYLWGKDSWETADALKQELGKDFSVLAIGQAGENGVRFACPVADYDHAPGRSTAGGVMGMKKLKAIAVRGTGSVPIAAPARFEAAARKTTDRIVNHPERTYADKLESLFSTKRGAEIGLLPSRNFQAATIPPESDIWRLPESAVPNLHGGECCYQCPMGHHHSCDVVAEVTAGPYAGMSVGGVGFPHIAYNWGADTGIISFPAMWKCRELSQRYGMDQKTPLAFAMELYQRGIISKSDAGGLELTWGNERAVIELLGQIAHRRGLGDILADGPVAAARKIGKGAERYAIALKGMSMLATDPRTGHLAKVIGYMVCPRGGDDLNTTHGLSLMYTAWARKAGWSKEKYLEWLVDWLDMFNEVKEQIFGRPPQVEAIEPRHARGKAAMAKWYGELIAAVDSVGLCLLPAVSLNAFGPSLLAELYSSCTGQEVTPREVMKSGERTYNLMRAFNIREGFSRKDDEWSPRFYAESLPHAGAITRTLIDGLLDEYYTLVGWDRATGIPTRAKLDELGLETVAGDIGAT